MHERHWGFALDPFDNAPDPRFFFPSSEHEEALMRLLYVIQNRKGAAALSGVFGCGKTLLTRTLLGKLGRDAYRVATITNPRLDATGLLRLAAHAMGIDAQGRDKAGLLIAIDERLRDNARDGKHTLLIIDEAHAIEDKGVLEELRMLLNFQEDDRFLLTLFLSGQPELARLIDSSKQFSQRVAMRYELKPFVREETAAYVRHRLGVAGASGEVFTDLALDAVHDLSGGIPRRINHICDVGLLIGGTRKADRVGPEMVDEAVHSMGGGV